MGLTWKEEEGTIAQESPRVGLNCAPMLARISFFYKAPSLQFILATLSAHGSSSSVCQPACPAIRLFLLQLTESAPCLPNVSGRCRFIASICRALAEVICHCERNYKMLNGGSLVALAGNGHSLPPSSPRPPPASPLIFIRKLFSDTHSPLLPVFYQGNFRYPQAKQQIVREYQSASNVVCRSLDFCP